MQFFHWIWCVAVVWSFFAVYPYDVSSPDISPAENTGNSFQCKSRGANASCIPSKSRCYHSPNLVVASSFILTNVTGWAILGWGFFFPTLSMEYEWCVPARHHVLFHDCGRKGQYFTRTSCGKPQQWAPTEVFSMFAPRCLNGVYVGTLHETNSSHLNNCWLEDEITFWNCLFSGAVLVFSESIYLHYDTLCVSFSMLKVNYLPHGVGID